MLSPGSPSKWQVQDSLSSTPSSLLYSESEQTEDELEVFSSESKAAGVVTDPKPFSFASGSSQNSKSTLTFVNKRSSRVENGQTGCSSASPAYTGQTSAACKRIPTEGDLKFARKCSELHGYIRPLLELLNGLKTGRYDKGLSTFQQTVAMDRLRRIVGVLQKPELGEKYMCTLLQLELMLKAWFPQVRLQHCDGTSSFHNFMASLPPRWNQDQLHIPVKKRRLSWSDSDSQSSSSSKRFLQDDRGPSPNDTSSWLSSSETTCSEFEEDSAICTNQNVITSEPKHTSHLLVQQKTNSLIKTPVTATGRPPPLVIPPPATDGGILGMQDCSVSSTTPTSVPPADLMISGKDLEYVKGEGPEKQVNSKDCTEMLNT